MKYRATLKHELGVLSLGASEPCLRCGPSSLTPHLPELVIGLLVSASWCSGLWLASLSLPHHGCHPLGHIDGRCLHLTAVLCFWREVGISTWKVGVRQMPPGVSGLDKAVTIFATVWQGCGTFCQQLGRGPAMKYMFMSLKIYIIC